MTAIGQLVSIANTISKDFSCVCNEFMRTCIHCRACDALEAFTNERLEDALKLAIDDVEKKIAEEN